MTDRGDRGRSDRRRSLSSDRLTCLTGCRGGGFLSERSAGVGVPLLLASVLAVAACRGDRGSGGDDNTTQRFAVVTTAAASAAQIVAALQASPGSPVQPGVAQGFTSAAGALQGQFTSAALAMESKKASVTFPGTSASPVHLQDVTT